MADKLHLLSFENLAQRVLYRYSFSFADFNPLESDIVSVKAQQAFYGFCSAVVRGIADDPSILQLPTNAPDKTMGANHILKWYPEIYEVRNVCLKALHDFSGFLFAAGLRGEYCNGQLIVCINDLPKLTAKKIEMFINLLENYGMLVKKDGDSLSFKFSMCPEALMAWQLLAAKCNEYPNRQVIRFILWMHNGNGAYFLERIKILLELDDDFFTYIAEKYTAKGYNALFDIDDYRTKYMYSKDVGGLSIEYATLLPTVRFVNNNSIGIKAALKHADELENGLKCQLIRFCKQCNDCMGCTKSGKNRQFTVMIRHDGNEYRLCPEFVQMEWYNNDISREKIDFMLELNELQEQFGKNWRKKK